MQVGKPDNMLADVQRRGLAIQDFVAGLLTPPEILSVEMKLMGFTVKVCIWNLWLIVQHIICYKMLKCSCWVNPAFRVLINIVILSTLSLCSKNLCLRYIKLTAGAPVDGLDIAGVSSI